MKFEDVSLSVSEKIEKINGFEANLIANKSGSLSFDFSEMMAETRKLLNITKKRNKPNNFNNNQNLY